MPSNKTVAAAPITTGVLLAGTAARNVAQHGLELWTALALTGGLSAIAVGLGVLTGVSGFNTDTATENQNWTTIAFAGFALTCSAVGAGLALA